MMGLSTSGSISLGWALVAGKKRVPRPAAGNTALRTLCFMLLVKSLEKILCGQTILRCDVLLEGLQTYSASTVNYKRPSHPADCLGGAAPPSQPPVIKST